MRFGLGMPGATKPNEESFNAAIELLQRAQRGG
jgi:hypothetical protein